MKKIFSRPSILPDRINHYDEHGHKIGYSRTTLLGYTNHYDEHGHKVGHSREGLLGTVHFDESGHRVVLSPQPARRADCLSHEQCSPDTTMAAAIHPIQYRAD